MEFRWLVFLTLWTTLSGPMLVRPSLGNGGPPPAKYAGVAVPVAPAARPDDRPLPVGGAAAYP